MDQREKALENLTKAERMFREMGMTWYLGPVHAAYAEVFYRKAEQSKARENLNKAIEIFRECGADGWAKKAEEGLAALT